MVLSFGAIAFGLVIGMGAAPAQFNDNDRTVGTATVGKPLELTATQRTAILEAVRETIRKEHKNVRPPPPKTNVQPSIGAQVPPSMELYILPDRVLAETPATRTLKYTMVEDKVVLVDPTNLRIVDIIDR